MRLTILFYWSKDEFWKILSLSSMTELPLSRKCFCLGKESNVSRMLASTCAVGGVRAILVSGWTGSCCACSACSRYATTMMKMMRTKRHASATSIKQNVTWLLVHASQKRPSRLARFVRRAKRRQTRPIGGNTTVKMAASSKYGGALQQQDIL